jgi:hypothetical protein
MSNGPLQNMVNKFSLNQDWALALPKNIRLGWKGQPGTNTLAYRELSSNTAVKSFITFVPVGATSCRESWSRR